MRATERSRVRISGRGAALLDRAFALPGFCEDPTGFTITVHTVGETRFTGGFSSAADLVVIDAWLAEDEV